MDKIAIVGTGLIGTSLGMAIRQHMAKGVTVVGTDRDRGNANDAQKMGGVDKVENSLRSAVEGGGHRGGGRSGDGDTRCVRGDWAVPVARLHCHGHGEFQGGGDAVG